MNARNDRLPAVTSLANDELERGTRTPGSTPTTWPDRVRVGPVFGGSGRPLHWLLVDHQPAVGTVPLGPVRDHPAATLRAALPIPGFRCAMTLFGEDMFTRRREFHLKAHPRRRLPRSQLHRESSATTDGDQQ